LETPISTPRLFLKILIAIAVAAMVVGLLLPMVAPDVGGTLGGLIGTAMLAILAGPVILWRMRAAVKKSHCNYTTDVVAPGWRLKLGVVTVLALGLSSSGVMAGKMHQPIRAEGHAGFELLAVAAITAVHKLLNRVTHRLNGLRGLYLASKPVELGGFQALMIVRTSSCTAPSWPTTMCTALHAEARVGLCSGSRAGFG